MYNIRLLIVILLNSLLKHHTFAVSPIRHRMQLARHVNYAQFETEGKLGKDKENLDKGTIILLCWLVNNTRAVGMKIKM